MPSSKYIELSIVMEFLLYLIDFFFRLTLFDHENN